MPVVFEKLAAQLKDLPFRTSDSGYDAEDVRRFLDAVATRLERLESRVEKAEARADQAERRLKGARRFARAGATMGADPSVLDDVVQAGQRRADEVAAEAAAEVERVRAAAASRVAAAQAAVDEPELRAEVDEHRRTLRRQLETCHVAQADLEAVDRAVGAGRHEILAGLEQDLRELKEARA